MVQNEFLKVFSFALWFGTKFQVFFSSAKWFKKEFQEFYYLPRKGTEQNYEVLSVFLVYKMVRNGIPSTLVFFINDSERNYVKFRCFLFAKSFWTEFCTFFIFRGMARNGILSVLRFAKQMEIRRKKTKFPFFSENGTPTPQWSFPGFFPGPLPE
jgi:hypothetical protein